MSGARAIIFGSSAAQGFQGGARLVIIELLTQADDFNRTHQRPVNVLPTEY